MNWAVINSRVLAGGAIALVSAFAAAQDADPPAPAEINNFVHPAGTETAPLGQLGHVEKRGNGPIDVILIPGVGFGWSVWDSFMTRNADRYTMYAITPAGMDGTKPPPIPQEIENFAAHQWNNGLLDGLVNLIKTQKLDQPLVVGHHVVGDHQALRMGLVHPDLVRGIVVVSGLPAHLANPGPDPAKDILQTTEQMQIDVVVNRWIPIHRTLTRESWLAGTYKPPVLCNDKDRGNALYEQGISTPFSTQIRYFLECVTTNPALRLPEIKVPLLVVYPVGDPDEERQRIRQSIAVEFSDPEDVERRVQLVVDQLYGGLETFRERFTKNPLWEALRPGVDKLTIEYVPETRIFIMDDQPDRLDELIEVFVKRLSAAGIE